MPMMDNFGRTIYKVKELWSISMEKAMKVNGNREEWKEEESSDGLKENFIKAPLSIIIGTAMVVLN